MKLNFAGQVRRFVGLAIRARQIIGRNGSARRQAAKNRSAFYESAWREAAASLDASIEEISPDIFRIQRGSQATHVNRNYTDLDGPVTLRLAGDKSMSQRLLCSAGLPTTDAAEFSLHDLSAAYSFLDRHQRCVIKPSSGTGAGQGITTNITSRSRLRYAVLVAAGFGTSLTIERQVVGENIRLLFLDGVLLDAVRRGPPHVTGDGKTSISGLVKQQNEQRLAGGFEVAQTLLPVDVEMRWSLAERNLNLRSTPAAGERVQLKSVVNDNMKSENDNISHLVSPALIDVGRRAALAIQGRVVGVDLIVSNVEVEKADHVVLEVNTTPGFYYHYHRSAAPARIAIPILERCLEDSGRR